MGEIKPALTLKVKDLRNLVRLLITWTTGVIRERTTNVLYFKQNNKHIYGAFTISLGYYELRGLPLFIWTEGNEPKGGFIKYRSQPNEELEFSDNTDDPKYQYLPIIFLSEPPPFVKIKE